MDNKNTVTLSAPDSVVGIQESHTALKADNTAAKEIGKYKEEADNLFKEGFVPGAILDISKKDSPDLYELGKAQMTLSGELEDPLFPKVDGVIAPTEDFPFGLVLLPESHKAIVVVEKGSSKETIDRQVGRLEGAIIAQRHMSAFALNRLDTISDELGLDIFETDTPSLVDEPDFFMSEPEPTLPPEGDYLFSAADLASDTDGMPEPEPQLELPDEVNTDLAPDIFITEAEDEAEPVGSLDGDISIPMFEPSVEIPDAVNPDLAGDILLTDTEPEPAIDLSEILVGDENGNMPDAPAPTNVPLAATPAVERVEQPADSSGEGLVGA